MTAERGITFFIKYYGRGGRDVPSWHRRGLILIAWQAKDSSSVDVSRWYLEKKDLKILMNQRMKSAIESKYNNY